jgi:quercetin dioxygenase-like cupin family protein
MKVKHWTDVPAQAVEGVEGVTIRWAINKQDGAPHFAMRVFDVQPGCSSPSHSHWWEHEVFVLDGEGVASGPDGETPISQGTVVLVPGGELHQFRNTGSQVLRFICLIPFEWLEGLAAQQKSPS